MATVVYRLTNIVNGKVYVGISARGMDARVSDHERDAKYGGGYALHAAMRKYGPDSFERSVIAIVETYEEAAALEVEYIAHHLSFVSLHGYNMTRGGEGAPGYTHTQEAKEEMSRSRKGRALTKEWRANMSASLKGRTQSKEWRVKRGLALKGKPKSETHRTKLSAALLGKKRADLAGEKHGRSKLTDIQRVEIYNLRVVQKRPRDEIAAKYGIALNTVWSVVQCVIRNGLVPAVEPSPLAVVAIPVPEKSVPVQRFLFDLDAVEVGSCDSGMCPAR